MLDFKPRGPNDPDQTFPRFHLQAVLNGFKTEQEGRQIFEDKEFVQIFTPGQARSVPNEPVNDEHKRRWPEHYRAFKEGLELACEGTPIEHWPQSTPAMVANLKVLHIKTVEQLAAVSDAGLQQMGLGARELRQKAQDYLDNASSSAPLERERALRAAAEEQSALLQAQLDQLTERLGALETRRGKPAPADA